MKPLRILIVTNRIPWPLNDGGAIAMYNAAKYLKLRGHQISLACLNTNKHYQDPKVLGEFISVNSVNIDTSVKAVPALMGLFQPIPYNIRRFQSAEFEKLLSSLVEKNEFDIVQMEGIYLALYAHLFRKKKCRLVLRSHNIESQIWKRLAESEKNPFKKMYLRNLANKIEQFEKKELHNFDCIIPITGLDEQFYKAEKFKGILETVNAGVDTDLFKPALPSNPNAVCFLGALDWLPNLEGLKWFVNEIWPLVFQKHPQAILNVAGKNATGNMNWLNQPGISFHGTVPDAPAFLSQSAIMVTPLRAGGGMRLKIVEAMAGGKAIVSTSIGAEGIQFSDCKNIFIADEAAQFANRILELLHSPESAKQMGAEARKLAMEKYSWASLAEKMEGVYRKLL